MKCKIEGKSKNYMLPKTNTELMTHFVSQVLWLTPWVPTPMRFTWLVQ